MEVSAIRQKEDRRCGMEVNIIRQKEDKIRVTIACNRIDEVVVRLKRHIELFHEKIR